MYRCTHLIKTKKLVLYLWNLYKAFDTLNHKLLLVKLTAYDDPFSIQQNFIKAICQNDLSKGK